MFPPSQHAALCRLSQCSRPLSVTHRAYRWLSVPRQETEALALLERTSSNTRDLDLALEVLCALQPKSPVFCDLIRRRASEDAVKWQLTGCLDRLPWYDGLRAFAQSEPSFCPDHLTAFQCLVRNKVFNPPGMVGESYRLHVHGLFRLLETARTSDPWPLERHHGTAMVLVMLANQLREPNPDPFVVYFTAMLFSRFSSLEDARRQLRRLLVQPSNEALQPLAYCTLKHLDRLHPDRPETALCG